MSWYVYRHIDPRSGAPFYFGNGCGDRATRIKQKVARNPEFAGRVSEIRAAGFEPLTEIVERFDTEREAYDREHEMIEEAVQAGLSLCNRRSAPYGFSGWVPTAEQREKMAAAKRGRPGNNRHVQKSEEWRAKIAASLTGKTGWSKGVPKSAEQRAKIAASLKGRKASPETRAKLSAMRKGRTLSPEHVEAIRAARWGAPQPVRP